MFPHTSCRAQAIEVERLRLVRQARLTAVAATAAVTLLLFAAISAHAAQGSQAYHAGTTVGSQPLRVGL